MKETNISCNKYRKFTHIAGVDVAIIIADKGKCVLTIKQCYYATNVDVSGNKTDGYFIDFMEDIKPMVVNSGNRNRIAKIVKIRNKCSKIESENIGNWDGLVIELAFDESIRMMGKQTGGIVVSPISPIPNISDKNAKAILNESKTIDELKLNWSKLTNEEQKLPSIEALKQKLKPTLK